MFHISNGYYSYWKLHRRKDLADFSEKSLPGVSILKPLVNSADPNLFENLETFFTLDYPKYEILFCVQETDDSRLQMYVDSLMQKYPSVESKVKNSNTHVSGLVMIHVLYRSFMEARTSATIPKLTTCILATKRRNMISFWSQTAAFAVRSSSFFTWSPCPNLLSNSAIGYVIRHGLAYDRVGRSRPSNAILLRPNGPRCRPGKGNFYDVQSHAVTWSRRYNQPPR